MRRLSGLILAGAIVLLPAFSQGDGAAYAQDAQALTFDGDIALWSIAVLPGRTADFEMVMARVKEALMKSDMPQRQQQAAEEAKIRLSTASFCRVREEHLAEQGGVA